MEPLVDRAGHIVPAALRTDPLRRAVAPDAFVDTPPDVLAAAADSGLAMNARLLEALRRSSANPLPVISDYTVEGSERRVIAQLRHHFDLDTYLRSRSFGRNLLALQRELGRTEIDLIRKIGATWHATAPESFRRRLQTEFNRAPRDIAAFALPMAAEPHARTAVAVIYATGAGHAQRYLRSIVSELNRRAKASGASGASGASVIAAVAKPEVFANLRIRRRALLLIGTPCAELLDAVRMTTAKKGSAPPLRDWGSVRRRGADSAYRATPHRARPERRQYAGRGRYRPHGAKTFALMSRR